MIGPGRVVAIPLGVLCAGVMAATGLAAGPNPEAPPYSLVDQIEGGDGAFDYISLDAARQRLFVGRDDRVTAVDLPTRRVIDRLLPGRAVHANLPVPGDRVISTFGAEDTAVTFDAATGRVLARAKTGKHPDAAAYDPATASVWIADYLGGDMTILDPASGHAVGRRLRIGVHPESPAPDGHGRLFVHTGPRGDHAVTVVDTRARRVVARYPLAGCVSASGLVYAPDEELLVSACRNGVAIALSARDGRELGRVRIGADADGALYDTARRRILIPAGESGVLDVLRPGGTVGLTHLAAVPTRVGSGTAALDPASGRVYLPAADFDPPPPGADEPVPRPGTFRILILAPDR